ncbi:MAG: hypothetical protein QOJ77_2469, partial [Microbacteriaceae bacterium]|nr:hypothetical protein [Microbacteriaceae bacterium]
AWLEGAVPCGAPAAPSAAEFAVVASAECAFFALAPALASVGPASAALASAALASAAPASAALASVALASAVLASAVLAFAVLASAALLAVDSVDAADARTGRPAERLWDASATAPRASCMAVSKSSTARVPPRAAPDDGEATDVVGVFSTILTGNLR